MRRGDKRHQIGWMTALLLTLLPAYGGSAVQAESPEAHAAGIEFFEKQIRPLLVQHCYECHSAEDINGGLRVDSRPALLRGGDLGPAVVPGEPDKSLLLEAVRYSNRDLQMPPQNKLSAQEIATLETWIKQGAPDPRTEESTAAPPPTGMSIADGKQFWSLQPLSKPAVPEVSQTDWPQNEVDHFILAALEQQRLRPAPVADKRTLIRRATYDLIGLPPTPQEVADFLADDSPEAFAKVIDRLLASPQYGVRWGRHWLDVARYADSNGLDENLAFGNAWRYRDYVIRSFNEDKPYHQFVREQLAGDLLPGANAETMTATGFLVLGAKVLAEPDREKLEMDTIDEQLDTVGKAFMGMTLGCVRCHDHKFDPVKHTDYYALAAIFKSTKTFADTNTGAIKHWNEHPLATDEQAEQIKEVDKQIAEKKRVAATFRNQTFERLREETRGLAVEYLKAAAQFDQTLTLNEVAEFAAPAGLHPRVLHHCRLHLFYHRDDEFFKPWQELAAKGDLTGIEQHYGTLFAEALAAWKQAKAADAKITALEDARLEQARAILFDAAGLLAVPAKPEFAWDDHALAEYYDLLEQARLFESAAADLPAAMGVTDGPIHTSLPLHIRGSHLTLGAAVDREFPEVMRISEVRPIFPAQQSGRLELADWLASSQHPLTARVYVNRVWRWHFGQGLVNTPDNFGVLGDRPSHPELLDWLARQFIEQGWSTKQMHRLLMLSATYQMDSVRQPAPLQQVASAEQSTAGVITAVESTGVESTGVDQASGELADPFMADPENRLYWKFPLQRLSAEQLRDAVLAVSGRLDSTLEGKTVPLRNRQFVFDHTSIDHTQYDSLRRAVYLPVIRNNLYVLFEQFDFPDPTMPTGHRQATVVAPQALLMMNSELVIDSARALAGQLLKEEQTDSARLQRAYELCFSRQPTPQEQQRAAAYLADWLSPGQTETESETETNRAADAALAAESYLLRVWTVLCHSLLASNEFIFVR